MREVPYKEAEYYHHKRYDPKEFVPGTFRNVPITHTEYKGKKHKVPGAEAVIGVHKRDTKKEGPRRGRVERIQTILTPIPPEELEKKRRKAEERRKKEAEKRRKAEERRKKEAEKRRKKREKEREKERRRKEKEQRKKPKGKKKGRKK